MPQEGDKFECVKCGAALFHRAGLQALHCPHCDGVTAIRREGDASGGAPDLVIPLSVEEDALREAVFNHPSAGEFAPDDLLERAEITKLERFYVPMFACRGRYKANWTASFGYDRTEHYTVHVERYAFDRKRDLIEPVTRTICESRLCASDAGMRDHPHCVKLREREKEARPVAGY